MKAKIKTWQEAFAAKGINAEIMPDVSMLPEAYRKPQIALFKLHVVAEVLNEGWQPDYTDHNQYKYFPWFVVQANKDTPSGFGLSYAGYDDWHARSGVGVRLCFKTSDLAKYAGTQFKELYEELYLF